MDSAGQKYEKPSNVAHTTAATFQYRPLDTATSEIRLVCLRANVSLEDGLEVESYHVSLDDISEYTACSYTWGDGVQPSANL